MKKFLTSSISIVASVLVSSIVVATVVYAGNLVAPSGTPSAQSYTLGDIYARLTTNATATAGNHSLSTSTSPAASFRTLTEIYGAIPTIDATKVATGTTYLGVNGSAYPAQILKTGQTTCYDFVGNPLGSCAGTGEDGETQKGIAASYTDNGNGTVMDNLTGLIWQQCSVGLSGAGCATGSASQLDMTTASSTCDTLVLGGYSDWRLPNLHELTSIVDYSLSYPAINGTYFPNTVADYYWSSSIYVAYPLNSWLVKFTDGFINYATRDVGYFVRCVRG